MTSNLGLDPSSGIVLLLCTSTNGKSRVESGYERGNQMKQKKGVGYWTRGGCDFVWGKLNKNDKNERKETNARKVKNNDQQWLKVASIVEKNKWKEDQKVRCLKKRGKRGKET